jgi:hypothetical protein
LDGEDGLVRIVPFFGKELVELLLDSGMGDVLREPLGELAGGDPRLADEPVKIAERGFIEGLALVGAEGNHRRGERNHVRIMVRASEKPAIAIGAFVGTDQVHAEPALHGNLRWKKIEGEMERPSLPHAIEGKTLLDMSVRPENHFEDPGDVRG